MLSKHSLTPLEVAVTSKTGLHRPAVKAMAVGEAVAVMVTIRWTEIAQLSDQEAPVGRMARKAQPTQIVRKQKVFQE